MDTQKILETKGNQVISVGPGDTVVDAARALAENVIGAVVVTENGGDIVGILSERDIAKSVSAGDGNLSQLRVEDLMSRQVVLCSPHDSIADLMNLMESNGIRHLPVVKDGELVGIISLRDVVTNWLGSMEIENEELRRRLGEAA